MADAKEISKMKEKTESEHVLLEVELEGIKRKGKKKKKDTRNRGKRYLDKREN